MWRDGKGPGERDEDLTGVRLINTPYCVNLSSINIIPVESALEGGCSTIKGFFLNFFRISPSMVKGAKDRFSSGAHASSDERRRTTFLRGEGDSSLIPMLKRDPPCGEAIERVSLVRKPYPPCNSEFYLPRRQEDQTRPGRFLRGDG